MIPMGIIAAVLALLAYGLLQQSPLEGKPAPNFSLTSFDGQQISLGGLRGRVVVLNLWASWCPPCREEAPALESIWREYEGKGVAFVGVNVKDTGSQARAFIGQFALTYPNGPDPYGRISKAYRVYALPETFVISRNGQVAIRYAGAVTAAQLRGMIEKLLQQ